MSNPSLEARASVECFQSVGYMNDGLHPYNSSTSPYGFVLDGAMYSTDKDVGSLITTYPSYTTIWANLVLNDNTLSVSDYPYVIVRGKQISDSANWKFGVKYTDNSETFSPLYSNTTWDRYVLAPDTLKSYQSIALACQGTAYFDYVCISSTIPMTLHPLSMTVDRLLTEEISSAEITLDYEDVKDVSFLGSHLKIWLAKETIVTTEDYHKVFTGKVEKVSKTIQGHTPRDLVIEATGYGKYLQKKMLGHLKVYDGRIHDIVRGMVSDLVEDGLITSNSISTFSDHTRKKLTSNQSVFDALVDLAEDYGADFYVDIGGDLNFFRKGTRVNTINIDVDETVEYPYSEDINSLINYQEVVGLDGKTLGTDLEYSDSTVNWSCSGILAEDTDIYDPAGNPPSIRCSLPSGGTIWFARDMGTLDLSLGGVLHFSLQLKTLRPEDLKSPTPKIRTYFIGPEGQYFVDVEASGGLSARRSLYRYDGIEYPMYVNNFYFWYYPMTRIDIPFNYKAGTEEQTIGTNPDWSEINTIKVEILDPLPSTLAVAWLDNMSIDGVYYSATISNTLSIKEYGRSEGVPIGPDPSLDTPDKCTLMASLIVATYKDPIRVIEDVKTIRSFDYNLGDECTLSVKEMSSVPVILRNIRHELEGMNFDTYLTFSKRYIPSAEKLLATAKKQLEAYGWNIEAWKRAKQPTNITPTRSEEIEFWETDLEFPRAALVSAAFAVSLGDSTSNYELKHSEYFNTFEVGGGGYYRLKVANAYDTQPGFHAKGRSIRGNNKIQFRFKVIPDLCNTTISTRQIYIGIRDPDSSTGYSFYFEAPPGTSNGGSLYFRIDADTWGSQEAIGTWTSGNTYDCWAIINPDIDAVHVYVNEQFKCSVSPLVSGTFYPIDVTTATQNATMDATLQVEIFGYQVAQAW